MRRFIKIDVDLDNHPKALMAGFEGVVVFERLLRLNGRLSRDGIIPRAYASPLYLATLWRIDTGFVERGKEQALASGLIGIDQNGDIHINGWDDEWRPGMSNAERQKAFRERQAHRDIVTDSNGEPLRRNDSNGCNTTVTEVTLDKTRIEENR